MTQVADPGTTAPPAPTTAPGAPAQAAPAPRPAPEPDDGLPDPDDPEFDDLNKDQRQNRLNRRLRRAATTAREENKRLSAENEAMKTQLAQLTTQNGSVTQLRASLLATAVRAEASTLVVPEALDDTIRLLDLSDLKVGDDGTVDAAKVKEKVAALVKAKPYLAAVAGSATRPLPGGHGAPAPGSGHDAFNQIIRQAAGR